MADTSNVPTYIAALADTQKNAAYIDYVFMFMMLIFIFREHTEKSVIVFCLVFFFSQIIH